MALEFSGTDRLVFTQPYSGAFDNSTLLVVMRRYANSGGVNSWAFGVNNSSGTGVYGLGFGTTDRLRLFAGGSVSPAVLNATLSDGWICVAVSKSAGTVTPRFHKYVYATGADSHENGTVAVSSGSVAGALATMHVGRALGAVFSTSGSYAAVAVYTQPLSDSEFVSAAQSLASLKSYNPSGGLWVLDGESLSSGAAEEFFVGSAYVSDTATSIDSAGNPFGYGQPVEMDAILGPTGSTGTATFTGGGVLSIVGSGSIAPPDPSPPIPVGTGWTMLSVTPAGVTTDVKFTDTGNFTHDQSRPIRRAISGFTLLPSEAAKLDLARDSIHAYLRVDEQSYPMGIFYFTESSRQKDAIIGPDGLPADLIHVSLSDQFIRLQRSDEVPRVALAGADPSQEMIRYISETDVPHSITGAENPIFSDVLWQPFTPYEAIVSQLAEIAGHRRPWADNYGVIRSVASRVVDSDIIPLEDLEPVAGTVVITENYLSAPNRVVVYDDQAGYPVVGSWDAPASAPNNATTRGWVTTAGVQAQGLSGPIHAQQVAETIGEQLSSRRLSCDIVPTNRLDGPVVLSYDNALWLVDSWSVSTKVGSTMSFDATELIISPGTES